MSQYLNEKKNAVIKVSNLKKTFGDLAAVDGLSFEVYKGEIFGFLGPNGAGKTTSINMICGLIEPTAGDVTILGNGKIAMILDIPQLVDYVSHIKKKVEV